MTLPDIPQAEAASAEAVSIGEASRQSGLSVDTLRCYDREGLLGELPRDAGGRRLFDVDMLGLLDVLVALRRTGMPIDQVRAFSAHARSGVDATRAGRLALLREHRTRVHADLAQLNADLELIDLEDRGLPGRGGRARPTTPKGQGMTSTNTTTTSRTKESWTGRRQLGVRGPETSALGIGTWAIGGPWDFDGRPAGWGSPDYVRRACRESLRRLKIETIDVYQLHDGASSATEAEEVVATLEGLVDDGLIRWYGTSVDAVEVIDVFARAPHSVTVQTQANVFGRTDAVLAAGRRGGLAVLARSPLAMGLLAGTYDPGRRPAAGDVRLDTPWWDYFDENAMPAWLARLAAVRGLLTAEGGSLVQGSLRHLWGLDDAIVPIPGVRTPAQAAENAAALALGPLPVEVVEEVDRLLADSPERR